VIDFDCLLFVVIIIYVRRFKAGFSSEVIPNNEEYQARGTPRLVLMSYPIIMLV